MCICHLWKAHFGCERWKMPLICRKGSIHSNFTLERSVLYSSAFIATLFRFGTNSGSCDALRSKPGITIFCAPHFTVLLYVYKRLASMESLKGREEVDPLWRRCKTSLISAALKARFIQLRSGIESEQPEGPFCFYVMFAGISQSIHATESFSIPTYVLWTHSDE